MDKFKKFMEKSDDVGFWMDKTEKAMAIGNAYAKILLKVTKQYPYVIEEMLSDEEMRELCKAVIEL